jgi:hypothetical protein
VQAARAEASGSGAAFEHPGMLAEVFLRMESVQRERARLEATFESDALEGELRALREEHFADEAPTIEAEGRDGFFRFDRPRVYGRN